MAKDKMYKTMSYALLNNNDKNTFYFVSTYKMCAYSHVYIYIYICMYSCYIMFSDVWQGRLKLTFGGRALVFM